MTRSDDDVAGLVDHLFRTEYGKLVAVLTSALRLRNLDVVEDIAQDTLATAYRSWSYGAVPDNPSAWLMKVAKNKALNVLRSEARERRAVERVAELGSASPPDAFFDADIEDSMLRMVFACAHPALDAADQIALVLKVLAGLGSGEVARALLASRPAIDKRLYRAKQQIVETGVRFEVPGGEELLPRLDTVCTCVYLLFNEGHSATAGDDPIRADLCYEALRLGRLLVVRFPDQPRIAALMALMCLHTARLPSRIDDRGALVLLADQDRTLWSRELIQSGMYYLSEAARGEELTTYHLEASIAAQHCVAPSFAETDWKAIHHFYSRLQELTPNPLVRLNLAIVRSRLDGAAAAIPDLEALRGHPKLSRLPWVEATLGELHRELGQFAQAQACFEAALPRCSPRERSVIETKLERLAQR